MGDVGRVHRRQAVLGFELLQLLNIGDVLDKNKQAFGAFVLDLLHALLVNLIVFDVLKGCLNRHVLLRDFKNRVIVY